MGILRRQGGNAKWGIACVLSTFLIGFPVWAATTQPTSVDADTTWKGEILVQDDVTVRPNVTLTVDGATVRFARRAGLFVHGRLVAKDSTFTSTEPKASPGAWRGIEISHQSAAFEPPVQPASQLEGCTIEFARSGVTTDGAHMGAPIVKNNSIRKCRWGGVIASHVKDLVLADNRFNDICLDGLSDQGRAIALIDCTSATITGNTVHDCSDTGVYLERSNECEIERNIVDHISGGPGPGPGGYYKQWAFAIMLVDSDRNRIARNTLTNIGYQSLLVAYGSDENVAEDNTIEWTLDSINVLGDGRNNVFRRNKVNGGWSVLYHNGPGPTIFEQCNIADAGGGACFTVRTGTVIFRDCTWNKANGMNIWGGDVTVERCKLTNINGANLSLKNDAKAKIVSSELDWSKVEIDAKFTGHFDRPTTHPTTKEEGKR
jgi:parallel beta-helix repeat protein